MNKLDKVIKLIEKGWCQFTEAKDAKGRAVHNKPSSKATQYCVIGAIRKATGRFDKPEARAIVDALKKKVGTIPSWNDEPGQTKENVIKVLKEINSGQVG